MKKDAGENMSKKQSQQWNKAMSQGNFPESKNSEIKVHYYMSWGYNILKKRMIMDYFICL